MVPSDNDSGERSVERSVLPRTHRPEDVTEPASSTTALDLAPLAAAEGASAAPPPTEHSTDLDLPPPAERVPILPGRRAPGETTLLSLPAPADASELVFEDRLIDCERKIAALQDRMRVLESRPTGGYAAPEQNWLVWVVFLLALAVAWQLFQGAR
jgi:hypothetical protein